MINYTLKLFMSDRKVNEIKLFGFDSNTLARISGQILMATNQRITMYEIYEVETNEWGDIIKEVRTGV